MVCADPECTVVYSRRVVLLTSNWEGLPLVLLEAAASALPIVATDVGGNREILRASETGYLVPAHDSAALARRMADLVALPESERAAMGAAGRRHVAERYDLERVVDTWESVYLEALSRRRAPGAAG